MSSASSLVRNENIKTVASKLPLHVFEDRKPVGKNVKANDISQRLSNLISSSRYQQGPHSSHIPVHLKILVSVFILGYLLVLAVLPNRERV